jgi:DNA polymerase/3'-5' exonuclease PolX
MATKTVRYTATLPSVHINELKEMAKIKKIPSVNFAINEALNEYLKRNKKAQYEALMKEAGHDEAYLERTLKCAEDFTAVDGEVANEW